jgi:GTP-binding protein
MQNIFTKTTFMQGVLNIKKAPPDEGFEFVLAGRSNAGKSSALNCLTKNKKLARTSKMPGRTTEINFFKVNDEIKLVDLPGYGFSKMSIDKKKNLDILLDNYFSSRQSLCAAIIFMDIRHPLKDSDIQMMEFCNRHGVPFISVLTKSDKLNSSAIAKSTKSVEKKLNSQSIIVTTSNNDEGFDRLSKKILEFIK